MKKILIGLAAATAIVSCNRPRAPLPRVPTPVSVEIAPPAEALTFARFQLDGMMQLLAVGSYKDDRITACNLTQALGERFRDPVDAFNALGYDALREQIETALKRAPIELAAKDLLLPLVLMDSHVAAGTNFAAHAEESSVEDGPFLFTKHVKPTPFRSSVSAGDALLDYEVELAFVTLSDTPLPGRPRHMGLILANDFTDRAKLMRNLNPADVTSGEGFTTGKSAEGYLPVGNLFVIPRDLKSFTSGIELGLEVNGVTRQKGAMTLLIWDIDELLRQTQARKDVRWKHLGMEIGLPVESDTLPGRTLIISGTPAGTIFSGIPKWTMAAGVARWLAGGWNKPVTERVIENYIAAARKKRNYLQPGDQVDIRVDRLGAIETTIVK